MPANHAIAWAITYLLHSTLLLSLAWLASRRLARRSVKAEEVVWRVALVGGLLTASIQLAAGFEPLAGRLLLPETAAVSAPAPIPVRAELGAPERPSFLPVPAAPAPVSFEAAAPEKAPLSLPALALGAWALGALLLTARCVASVLRLRRRIEHRPRVVGGTLFDQLSRLTAEAGFARPVRLTCSSRLPVPVALGVRRAEISVPPRALVGLSPEEQEGLLAHELAHVARHDSLWLVFGQILASILFFQPLNFVARRRLREISEILSDEWAVNRTGQPLSLASCLAEVAGWSVGPVRLPVPGMADRPSNLGHRIRRLLDEARSPERGIRPVWLGAALVILLVAVAAAAPGVSAAVKQQRPEAASAAVEDDESEEAEEAEEWEIEEDDEDAQEDEREAQLEAEREAERDGSSGDLDVDLDLDDALDLDFDFDFDLESEIGELAQLEGLHDQLAALAESETLSPEEQQRLERDLEKMNAEVEKITEEVERSLRPQIERMQQEIERSLKPEMDRLQEEIERSLKPQMDRLGREIEDSLGPEMERLERELEQLENEHGLSGEEIERIQEEAQRLSSDASRRALESAEVQKAIRDAQRESREATRQALEEHKAEMDALRQQIDEQVRPLREQMERKMEETYRRDVRREKEREKERERQERRDSEDPPGS
jgi:beta-lactamase regulating signal transducer with metallopeptidase domain